MFAAIGTRQFRTIGSPWSLEAFEVWLNATGRSVDGRESHSVDLSAEREDRRLDKIKFLEKTKGLQSDGSRSSAKKSVSMYCHDDCEFRVPSSKPIPIPTVPYDPLDKVWLHQEQSETVTMSTSKAPDCVSFVASKPRRSSRSRSRWTWRRVEMTRPLPSSRRLHRPSSSTPSAQNKTNRSVQLLLEGTMRTTKGRTNWTT